MNTAFSSPTPLHQAALAIHSLREEDAAWMMAALPAEQKRALTPLLSQLTDLAIPRDTQLIRELVPERSREPENQQSELDLLDREAEAKLVALLAAEPPELAQHLLRCKAWPWQERVARELDLVPRQTVMPAPALKDALQAACGRALRTRPAGELRASSRRMSAWMLRLRSALRSRA
jgi:hypothetical protein